MLFLEVMDPLVLGWVIAGLLLLLGLYRWISIWVDKDRRSYPPMIPTGFCKMMASMAGDDNPWFLLRTAQTMGTSVFRLPMYFFNVPTFTVVGDAKLARAILTDKETIKPYSMYGSIDYITNRIPSLFTTNGPYWHSRRKGIAHGFSSNHVHRMNAVALAKCDQWIETRLKPLIDEGQAFDVGDEMIDLLLCAITETAFEYTISPMEVEMFKEELAITLKEFLFKSTFMPWRKAIGWMHPEVRRATLAAKRIQALCFKIIEAYKKLENPTQGTIINLIMCNQAYKSDEERAADIAVLLLAGHDTTAYSLAWTLKELAMNPGIQKELRQSIMQDDLQAPHQLESVRNTIKESIRLYPVSAAGSARCVGRDFATKDGKLIPAGSITLLPYIIMMRDAAVFGEDSDQFNPVRWETATHEMNQSFMAFAFGRQNCVGQTLANAELHCILPRIISQFELTIDQPGHCECFLTMKPANTMLRAKPIAQS